jgi:hypothetical protein
MRGRRGKRLVWKVLWALCGLVFVVRSAHFAASPQDHQRWRIHIINDTCPDYTWGLNEEQTRQAFADLIRTHLDEMQRTETQPTENQDRYNMAATMEALCFLERYPERRAEFVRRLKEGRILLSPFLCNSLWGFQSVEGAIRTLYPARRLEREWGVPIDIAHHIELPSLPWGMASILAGCGVRWLSVPFYNYDSTFTGLTNPPLFILEGPDGQKIRIVLDAWASNKANYAQGAYLLNKPAFIRGEFLPHYQSLGSLYGAWALLASGTHSDISPHSGEQSRGFAQAIIDYNSTPGDHPMLVNSTLRQFCKEVDEAQMTRPFLPTLRGCFGHSWESWPVCLAKYVAGLRTGERDFLSSETLVALASLRFPGISASTQVERERAEWCWAMLSDHAWNGTDDSNRNVNAELRRLWSHELQEISRRLQSQAWKQLGLRESADRVVLFNSLSMPRAELVRLPAPEGKGMVSLRERVVDSQVIEEEGKRYLYFVSPAIPGVGFLNLELKPAPRTMARNGKLRATATELESPFYLVKIDPVTGAIRGLKYKPTNTEWVSSPDLAWGQTVYFDGEEHQLTEVRTEVLSQGPVLSRLSVVGTVKGIKVINGITVYSALDRVDLDLRIEKPMSSVQQRLCHRFPVSLRDATLRIETTGAVLRPRPQPDGDLLPGADHRRFAVQGFVDITREQGPGITLVPLDAYLLRTDLEAVTFEALGNDQNYKEVIQDQHGETQFQFRYSIRAHPGCYDPARAFEFSRNVATPLMAALGSLESNIVQGPVLTIEPQRAMLTCFKPALDATLGANLLRLWEIAGKSGPITIRAQGVRKAILTDLLERNLKNIPVRDDTVTLDLRAHGFAALRLQF